jgi:hypothetical protein
MSSMSFTYITGLIAPLYMQLILLVFGGCSGGCLGAGRGAVRGAGRVLCQCCVGVVCFVCVSVC